jgi:hypothetical protein
MDAFCIKICVTPDGMTVSSEPLDDAPQGEPVESIDAALERARALYAEQSGGAAGAGGEEQQAEQDFMAGFA